MFGAEGWRQDLSLDCNVDRERTGTIHCQAIGKRANALPATVKEGVV